MMLGTFATFGRRHIYSVFAVGREYAVESNQVYPGHRHQRRQLGDKIQWLKDDVRGPIAVQFESTPCYHSKKAWLSSGLSWVSYRTEKVEASFLSTAFKRQRCVVSMFCLDYCFTSFAQER
jgi:hypothetical protein